MIWFPRHTGTSALVDVAQVSPLGYRTEAWQLILVGASEVSAQ